MTGAVQSGVGPTEANLCNPQTCSCLLELLLLLPDMAAGTACCTRHSCIQGVGGALQHAELDSGTASVLKQAVFDDWQCQAAQARHDCQTQIRHCTLISLGSLLFLAKMLEQQGNVNADEIDVARQNG